MWKNMNMCNKNTPQSLWRKKITQKNKIWALKKKKRRQKEPYIVEKKKKINQTGEKKFLMVRYRVEEWQKKSKSPKNPKVAKCQPDVKIRLHKKRKTRKTYIQGAIKQEICLQID